MEQIRITPTIARLMRVFLEEPGVPRFGFDLMQRTGLASGAVYPTLSQLETAGWLIRENEAASVGQPRKLYRIASAEVQEHVRTELKQLIWGELQFNIRQLGALMFGMGEIRLRLVKDCGFTNEEVDDILDRLEQESDRLAKLPKGR